MEPLPYTRLFKKGNKIRCINPGPNDLIKGTIYTFKRYLKVTTVPERPCLEIEEPTEETGYFADRFEIVKEYSFDKLYERMI